MTYGRLRVIDETGRFTHRGSPIVVCKCACGKVIEKSLNSLNTVRSCGCLIRTKEYSIWHGIKSRCSNPKAYGFKDYGGRGIRLCKEWYNDFWKFYEDMGKCPSGLTIDRIDDNKGYNKANCRWATRAEQARNRRNTKLTPQIVILIRDNKLDTQAVIAKQVGVNQSQISKVVNNKEWK